MILCSTKNVGPKKILGQKKFGSNYFGSKEIMGANNFWVQKVSWSEKLKVHPKIVK